jgi:hypothetical protein
VDVTAELQAPCAPDELFAWVEELDRNPQWLDIVPRVESAPAHPDDIGPAWQVTLRGRLGALARSKRLRMVRVEHQRPTRVRFERHEHDGREHAAWVLTADVTADGDGMSLLTMKMHYGGSLGGGPVRKLLEEAIADSRPRLLACVGARSESGR